MRRMRPRSDRSISPSGGWSSLDAADFTRVLQVATTGDGRAIDRVFEALYDELRAMARRKLLNERRDHTLQPTALVHEAYARLVRSDVQDWHNKAHFLAIAARVMRQILVDYARRRGSKKRRGAHPHVPLDEDLAHPTRNITLDLVALDVALSRLHEEQPEKAQVVEMRFFAGMTHEEMAEVLGVTSRTVKRYLAYAQTRLYTEMMPENED